MFPYCVPLCFLKQIFLEKEARETQLPITIVLAKPNDFPLIKCMDTDISAYLSAGMICLNSLKHCLEQSQWFYSGFP